MKLSGMKIVAMMVRTVMISFIRVFTADMWYSRSPPTSSR